MREPKFRVWDKTKKEWLFLDDIFIDQEGEVYLIEERTWAYQTYMHKENLTKKVEVVRFTGLKDKNGNGCYEVYEGDIITIEGKIRGNIYENEPRRTDIVIPPIGTKAWNTTYQEAVDRGFDYSE